MIGPHAASSRSGLTAVLAAMFLFFASGLYADNGNGLLATEAELLGFSLLSNFLFLVLPLAWNLLFSSRLPMDHFEGKAPAPLLVAENVLRIAAFAYPIFLPIDTTHSLFVPGIVVYAAGMAAYFGSWLIQMSPLQTPLRDSAAGRFAPAYLPLIWLAGMTLTSRSPVFGILSMLFVAAHVAEYVFRYSARAS
jgi:hypothetical protein